MVGVSLDVLLQRAMERVRIVSMANSIDEALSAALAEFSKSVLKDKELKHPLLAITAALSRPPPQNAQEIASKPFSLILYQRLHIYIDSYN
jgi:hypothetical protein